MPIPTPPFVPQPFANNADTDHKTPIPNTTGTPGRASYDIGFPPVTMQPEISGGIAPFGQDVNGILNALSAHVYSQQAGQLYRYSSDVSTAIGGYPVGTMLESTDGVTVWFNVQAANTGDPDANAAGWVPLFNYGYTTKSGLTGGTVALTRLEARRGVIVLSGSLVGNLTVIVPATLASWLIVNSTTGSFTTTVRTASGTGVLVPQGGFGAPTGIYGDGTNIYPTVAPLSVPIDQAATPLTLAQRTNNAYLLAAYFNQSSLLENPTIGAVFVQNSAADGYLRKISVAGFQSQLALQNFAGALGPSQVPLLQNMGGAITASQMPALSGISGLVTAAQVPASAVDQFFSMSASANGYVELPGGIILQWGTTGTIPGVSSAFESFPISFPSAAFVAVMTAANSGGSAQSESAITGLGTTGFTANNNASIARVFRWIAIGN